MQIETSIGDVVDRITILEIKLMHLADDNDPRKRLVERERRGLLWALESEGKSWVLDADEGLRRINGELWRVLDEQRNLDETRANWDARQSGAYIMCARAICHLNDRRAELKNKINERAGSAIREVKVYPSKAA